MSCGMERENISFFTKSKIYLVIVFHHIVVYGNPIDYQLVCPNEYI